MQSLHDELKLNTRKIYGPHKGYYLKVASWIEDSGQSIYCIKVLVHYPPEYVIMSPSEIKFIALDPTTDLF